MQNPSPPPEPILSELPRMWKEMSTKLKLSTLLVSGATSALFATWLHCGG